MIQKRKKNTTNVRYDSLFLRLKSRVVSYPCNFTPAHDTRFKLYGKFCSCAVNGQRLATKSIYRTNFERLSWQNQNSLSLLTWVRIDFYESNFQATMEACSFFLTMIFTDGSLCKASHFAAVPWGLAVKAGSHVHFLKPHTCHFSCVDLMYAGLSMLCLR